MPRSEAVHIAVPLVQHPQDSDNMDLVRCHRIGWLFCRRVRPRDAGVEPLVEREPCGVQPRDHRLLHRIRDRADGPGPVL